MDTAVDHAEDHAPAAHGTHHSDLYYIKIAIYLAIITGAEVALTEVNVGPLFLPLLFLLMAVKFAIVVLYFMHLKDDSKIFGFLFWSGLALAVGVYVAFLATMKFFLA
jgi:cytochrome c oxidase subunit IV